jgi:hypothetical protein
MFRWIFWQFVCSRVWHILKEKGQSEKICKTPEIPLVIIPRCRQQLTSSFLSARTLYLVENWIANPYLINSLASISYTLEIMTTVESGAVVSNLRQNIKVFQTR